MNVFAAMLARVQATVDAMAAESVLPPGLDTARVVVAPPRDPAIGDMTTNAALILASEAGQEPRALADAIAAKLRTDALVARAEVAGPGFINITLRPEVWTRVLSSALADPKAYGQGHNANASTLTIYIRNINGFLGLSHLSDKAVSDVVRLSVLLCPPGAGPIVDPAMAAEQSYDNPAFCVRYAHARAHAMYGRAREAILDLPNDAEARAALLRDASLARLTEIGECTLLRLIAQYPHWIETAVAQREPHRLAAHLHALASAFHTHLRLGMATPHLRFIIQNDRELTVARLALVEAVVIILAAGLALLGVEAPDEIT